MAKLFKKVQERKEQKDAARSPDEEELARIKRREFAEEATLGGRTSTILSRRKPSGRRSPSFGSGADAPREPRLPGERLPAYKQHSVYRRR